MLELGYDARYERETRHHMTFEQTIPARLVFRDDPVRVAVAQIRFARTQGLHDPAILTEIGRRLPELPDVNLPPGQVNVPLPGGARFAFSAQGPAKFQDAATSTVVSVAQDAVSVETNDYPGWAEFSARVERTLRALDDLLPPHITRVGLRYVNELFVPGAETPADWARLLEPSLVAPYAGSRFSDRVRQTLQQIAFDMGEGHEITLRHGFIRRRDLPETVASSLYLFDVDAYQEQPMPRDPGGVMALLERYHSWTWALFRGSIGDELIAAMGGEPA
jgi:uncharacterized protein (TIGR04255 family)